MSVGWDEVRAAFRQRFTLDRDEEHEFSMTLAVGPEGRRAQRVMLRYYEALGVEMVEIRSAFSEAKGQDPDALLAENLKLKLGAVARHGDFLVLVHRLSLDFVQVDGVVFYARQVARLSDLLEARGGGDRF